MRKKIILLIVVVLAAVFFSYALLKKSRYVSNHAYLMKVYPLLSRDDVKKIDISQLSFYYYPFPIAVKKYPNATGRQGPPSLNQLYCLSWMSVCGNVPEGTMFKNVYPASNASVFPYKMGFPSNTNTEVMHYGWYHEPGIYYYHAKGTGIFLSLGRTLVASNKVAALKKLGLTNLDILSLSNHYVIPYPIQQYGNTYATIKHYAASHHISFSKAIPLVFASIINNTDYNLNRIADSSSYDLALYLQCRKQHYDTLQLTASPNDNGGWGFEIMDCRTSIEESLIHRWQKEKQYLKQCNPLDHAECQPCQFKLPLVDKLYCQSQRD